MSTTGQGHDDALREHINRFERYVERLLPGEQDVALSLLTEFRTTIEELQVAEEELANQNGELIAAREQTEKERRRYQELFDFAPDGYIVTDPYGIILEANRSAQMLLGIEHDEITRKPFAVYIMPDDRRAFRLFLSLSKSHGDHASLEVRLLPRGRPSFYAELTLSTYVDLDGQKGLRWLLRDITERKKVEFHLRQSERRLADAQQIAHVGSWHWDIKSDTLTFSDEVYRIFGLSTQQATLTFESFLSNIHPGDRERVRDLIQGAREQKYLFAADFRIMRPDDEVRILYARGGFIADGSGSPASMVGSIQDVTDIRSAEESIRKLNAELEQRVDERTSQLQKANEELYTEIAERQKTAERLRALLQRKTELYRISGLIGLARTPAEVLAAMMDSSLLNDVRYAALIIFDHPWKDTQPERMTIPAVWNRATHKVSALSSGGQIDTSTFDLGRLITFQQPALLKDIEHDERLDESLRDILRRAQCENAILFPLNASGEWYGLLSLHFDVADLFGDEAMEHMRGLVDQVAIVIYNLRLLESESKARMDAEHANQMRLQFLAMISHELRTPLTSIKGFSTTLLANDVAWEPTAQREFIGIIDSEADKLKELIDQLLDLSRLEAGLLSIKPEKVRLSRVLQSMQTTLAEQTKRHQLSVNVPSELPMVQADARRIAQVIYNLVDNAVKYSPAGTEIVISAEAIDGQVQINVQDNGKGIQADERQRVFEVFNRGSNEIVSRVRGAGLGLAICRGLVAAHGGRIWIRDEQRPGTTISFTLPQVSE